MGNSKNEYRKNDLHKVGKHFGVYPLFLFKGEIGQKADHQDSSSLTVCYMFQMTFALPSSLIMIWCIIIIATAFLQL